MNHTCYSVGTWLCSEFFLTHFNKCDVHSFRVLETRNYVQRCRWFWVLVDRRIWSISEPSIRHVWGRTRVSKRLWNRTPRESDKRRAASTTTTQVVCKHSRKTARWVYWNQKCWYRCRPLPDRKVSDHSVCSFTYYLTREVSNSCIIVAGHIVLRTQTPERKLVTTNIRHALLIPQSIAVPSTKDLQTPQKKRCLG